MTHQQPVHILRQMLTKPWMKLRIFQGDTYITRTPDHYKKFYWEWKCTPRAPVHYIPKPGNFEKFPDGTILPVQDQPLPLKQPLELHEGIWGGEAVIKGFVKKKQTARRVPRYWVPTLKSTVVYSEVLDRYMQLIVTERTLKLIDEHYGFDNYILQTLACDLMSELALKIKREMLLTLVRGTLYPNDPAKREELLEKYKDYIIPEEEADWYGLNPKEAATKQKILEEEVNAPKPLKHAFRAEFIEHLKTKKEESTEEDNSSSGSNWFSRVNPFAKT